MGSPTVVHGSRRQERARKKEREREGVIALGATVEFSRSRTARATARINTRTSERANAFLLR